MQSDPTSPPKPPKVERHAQVSAGLREASRTLANQDGSRRTTYKTLGFKPLLRDRVFQVLFIAAFLLVFLAPLGAGLFYLSSVVSPQYASETRFVLRSAVPAISEDTENNDANATSMKIVQDTQVLVNFLDSRTMVELIDEKISLDRVYGRSLVDPLSRLKGDATLQEKTEYFEDFITSNISPTSGIVTVELRAFSPEEANQLLNLVMDLAEERVNLLNAEIWSTVLAAANTEFLAAGDDLQIVRQELQNLQNQTGVFDIELEAEALTEVLTELRKELVALESERSTLLISVKDDQPVVVRLNRQITVRRQQIETLERQIADARSETASLADNQQLFEELELRTEIAQDRFKRAAADLEQTKLLSSIQLLYVDQFMPVTEPDDIAYPKLAWEIPKLILLCLVAWAISVLLLNVVRSRMD